MRFKEAVGLFISYQSVFIHQVCQELKELNSNLPVSFFSDTKIQRTYIPNITIKTKNQGIGSHHLNTILNALFKIKVKDP